MGRWEGVKRLSCEPNVAFRGATGSQSIVVEGIEPVASVVYTQIYLRKLSVFKVQPKNSLPVDKIVSLQTLATVGKQCIQIQVVHYLALRVLTE